MTTVLIIDDEENLRKLLARVIELEGYAVLQAGTAKEGLKLIHKESIQEQHINNLRGDAIRCSIQVS